MQLGLVVRTDAFDVRHRVCGGLGARVQYREVAGGYFERKTAATEADLRQEIARTE
jgi:hypothetical protein